MIVGNDLAITNARIIQTILYHNGKSLLIGTKITLDNESKGCHVHPFFYVVVFDGNIRPV